MLPGPRPKSPFLPPFAQSVAESSAALLKVHGEARVTMYYWRMFVPPLPSVRSFGKS